MLKRFIEENLVFIHPHTQDKKALLDAMTAKAVELGYIDQENEFVKDILDREKNAVMELAPHIVLPHTRGKYIKKLFVMLAIDKKGVPYQGAKKNQAHIVMLIGVPQDNNEYLKLLASISRLMLREDFVKLLMDSEIPEDVLYAIKRFEVQIERSEQKNQNKYLVFLTIHKQINEDVLTAMLAEVGIGQPIQMEGENIGNAARFMPFLTTFGIGTGASKYSKCYLGLTDEKDAAAKIYTLLKGEDIDLNDSGAGFMAQIETMESYGGYASDMDF